MPSTTTEFFILLSSIRKRFLIPHIAIAITTLSVASAISLVPVASAAQSGNEELSVGLVNIEGRVVAPDDSANENRNVSGFVYLENESPAAGATVYLVRFPTRNWSLPVDPIIATTNSQGRFDYPNVEQGQYMIWAECDGLTTLKQKLQGQRLVVNESDPDPVNLQLAPGVNYDVTIVSAETGQGIENAEVSFAWTDLERSYLTDQNGRTQINGLAQDDWYFVIRAEGYATTFKKTSIQELGTNTKLQFQLSRGGSIRGQMVDDSGHPVVEGEVYIRSSEMAVAPSYAKVVTDMQGQFHITGLPLETELRVTAYQEDCERSESVVTVTDANESHPLEIVCTRRSFGGDLQVTVLDSEDRPVVGAELLNRGSSTNEIRSAITNANGTAILKQMYLSDKNLHPGSDDDENVTCNVIVRADRLVPAQFEVPVNNAQKPATKTVKLKKGGVVRGVLLRPDGTPAAKVGVFFNESIGVDFRFDRDLMWKRMRTDADGRFEQHGLTGITTLSVPWTEGCVPIRNLVVPSDSEKELKIQLKPAAVIRARAIDASTGQPIPQFNVRVNRCDQTDMLAGDINAGGIEVSLINPGVNVHGTMTEFRLGQRLPGTVYKLIVSADGYQTKTIPRVKAAVADGAQLLNIELIADDE